MNIVERAQSLTDLGAGWVMWLLVGLSVVSVAIVLDRVVYLARTRISTTLREQMRESLEVGDVAGTLQAIEGDASTEARVVAEGLRASARGAEAVRSALDAATTTEKHQLERRLSALATIGSNAPFVGLLGTVIGIIRAFQELDRSHGKVTSSLMSEVGEALVATAIGLLVALPAVAAFNALQQRVADRLERARAAAELASSYAVWSDIAAEEE